MTGISNSQWNIYKNIINKAHDSFNQDTIIWRRHIRGFQRYGEDTKANENYNDITLKCLISYNVFRTWPITKETTGGDLDKENITLILNKKYLDDLGYLNADGFFEMTPGKDQFIHKGLEYQPSGETGVAQASTDALLFYIILARQETNTGTKKY